MDKSKNSSQAFDVPVFDFQQTITLKIADKGRSGFFCSFYHDPLRYQLMYWVRYTVQNKNLCSDGSFESLNLI